jgi:hypothetical protein
MTVLDPYGRVRLLDESALARGSLVSFDGEDGKPNLVPVDDVGFDSFMEIGD